MPFDPLKPAAASPLSSAEMRAQLTALKALIDSQGAQLTAAIATTSANSNSVANVSLSISNPPGQDEVQTLANKLDELINALRR